MTRLDRFRSLALVLIVSCFTSPVSSRAGEASSAAHTVDFEALYDGQDVPTCSSTFVADSAFANDVRLVEYAQIYEVRPAGANNALVLEKNDLPVGSDTADEEIDWTNADHHRDDPQMVATTHHDIDHDGFTEVLTVFKDSSDRLQTILFDNLGDDATWNANPGPSTADWAAFTDHNREGDIYSPTIAAGNFRNDGGIDEVILALRDDSGDFQAMLLTGGGWNGHSSNPLSRYTSDSHHRNNASSIAVASARLDPSSNQQSAVVAMRDSMDRVQVMVLDADTTGTALTVSGYCKGSGQWGGAVTNGVGPVRGANFGAMRGVVDIATGDLDDDLVDEIVVTFLAGTTNEGQLTTMVLAWDSTRAETPSGGPVCGTASSPSVGRLVGEALWTSTAMGRGSVSRAYVAIGDLDGDGLGQVVNLLHDSNDELQVVSLDYLAGQLSVRESRTDDAGDERQRWWPTDLATGDINRDGKDEIVATAIEVKALSDITWYGALDWTSQVLGTQRFRLADDPGQAGTDTGTGFTWMGSLFESFGTDGVELDNDESYQWDGWASSVVGDGEGSSIWGSPQGNPGTFTTRHVRTWVGLPPTYDQSASCVGIHRPGDCANATYTTQQGNATSSSQSSATSWGGSLSVSVGGEIPDLVEVGASVSEDLRFIDSNSATYNEKFVTSQGYQAADQATYGDLVVWDGMCYDCYDYDPFVPNDPTYNANGDALTRACMPRGIHSVESARPEFIASGAIPESDGPDSHIDLQRIWSRPSVAEWVNASPASGCTGAGVTKDGDPGNGTCTFAAPSTDGFAYWQAGLLAGQMVGGLTIVTPADNLLSNFWVYIGNETLPASPPSAPGSGWTLIETTAPAAFELSISGDGGSVVIMSADAGASLTLSEVQVLGPHNLAASGSASLPAGGLVDVPIDGSLSGYVTTNSWSVDLGYNRLIDEIRVWADGEGVGLGGVGISVLFEDIPCDQIKTFSYTDTLPLVEISSSESNDGAFSSYALQEPTTARCVVILGPDNGSPQINLHEVQVLGTPGPDQYPTVLTLADSGDSWMTFTLSDGTNRWVPGEAVWKSDLTQPVVVSPGSSGSTWGWSYETSSGTSYASSFSSNTTVGGSLGVVGGEVKTTVSYGFDSGDSVSFEMDAVQGVGGKAATVDSNASVPPFCYAPYLYNTRIMSPGGVVHTVLSADYLVVSTGSLQCL